MEIVHGWHDLSLRCAASTPSCSMLLTCDVQGGSLQVFLDEEQRLPRQVGLQHVQHQEHTHRVRYCMMT